MGRYLVAQAEAGADALMLFDSWVGLLSPSSFQHFVLPVLKETVASIRSRVDRPIIYFANGGTQLLPWLHEVGADVLGVDWAVPMSRAVEELGAHTVVQGNLDPAALFAPRRELGTAIDAVLREGAGARAHIFNLGHGIHHATDPDQVAYLVDRVHETSSRLSAA
jgi:uroporphyrinogen decarboxylase